MKNKHKKMLSIFLILCLSLTMVMGNMIGAFAEGEGADIQNIDRKVKDVNAEEFLAMADANNVIRITQDIRITEPVVINDGKKYTIDTNYWCIYTLDPQNFENETERVNPYQSNDGTVRLFDIIYGAVILQNTESESSAVIDDPDWGIRANIDHAFVLNGNSKEAAVLDIKFEGDATSMQEAVLIKGGTLTTAGVLGCNRPPEESKGILPFRIIDEGNTQIAKVTITDGTYTFDCSKYLASDLTLWVDSYEEGGKIYGPFYIVVKKDNDIKAYWSGARYKGSNGFYFTNKESAKLYDITLEAIKCNFIYFYNAGPDGTYNAETDLWELLVLKQGTSILESFKLNWGVDFVNPDAPKGYHLLGWYNGNTKIDLDAKDIAEDLTVATKWCKDGNNKVINAKAATYEAEGYTGDTVCAECGILVEKGKAIPKLIKEEVKEEVKVEVKPEDGKIEVSEAPVVDGKVDVTDVIKDAVKEVVENVEAKITEVVISVAKVEGDVKKVELPVASVNEIADAKKALTVETKTATVTLDSKALSTVADKAQGDKLSLQVQEIKKEALSDKQKAALKDIKADIIISAEIICEQTNKVISSDFGGGKATVKLPFEAAEGSKLSDYTIVYIANDGSMLRIPTKVVDGALVFEIEHFSEYAVVKTADVANVPVAGETPKTGDATNMLPWLALMAVAGAGAAVLRKKKTYK